ncbi:MAG: SLBB domain-containing protein [Quadrisphaera sp.]
MSALAAPAPSPSPVTAPAGSTRLMASAARDLAGHLALLGPLPAASELTGQRLVELVHEAGLTGRGGAAFPTGRKLASLAGAARRGRPPVVVANGAEGEPASSKDHALLAHAPHLVLDGLALAVRAAGGAAGGVSAHLYAPAEVLLSLEPVLAERLAVDEVVVQGTAAPDRFVAGQSSAVASAVAGGPALPRTPWPPPRLVGAGTAQRPGRPTLVVNVETLAHLALLARHGAGWFRSVGADDEPGTRLVTVSGAVRSPRVAEVAGGAPLSELLELAGGPSEPLSALLVGGYHGGWVPYGDRAPHAAHLPHARAALAPWGADPGAGVVIALPARACGLRAGAEVARYLAGQTAGQCGPCVNGLPTLAEHLGALADAGARQPSRPHSREGLARRVSELHRVAGLVEGRGACHHPSGSVRLVRSTLMTFADDVQAHLVGRCLAEEELIAR